MPRPIAHLGHAHTCPIHGGGPVVNPGQTLVRFNGIPLAVEGGQCVCPHGPDPMVSGSSLVRINGCGVMRVGDKTAHGGRIVMGAPTLKAD